MSVEAFAPGLEGIVAVETALSDVDGERGELTISGYPVEGIASAATFEEVVYLLWHGRLPDRRKLDPFREEMAARRGVPDFALSMLREAAEVKAAPMDALRMAAGSLEIGEDDDLEKQSLTLVAAFPTLVATYWRLSRGEEPIAPDPSLGHAENYLYMLFGERPEAGFAKALETYLNTVADHGLNASTFAARVIISTRSDAVSAVVGAVGALKGPLHGGAPGPALDVVFEIGSAENSESVLRGKLERGERLMGFGHRIYKVRDPRADVLAEAAERLYATDGDSDLYRLALAVEDKALELLEEYKPGRRLQTNVEFYTALLLHGIGLPAGLFTPTFAVGRVAGWTAHCREQAGENRLFRPQSVYTGEKRFNGRREAWRGAGRSREDDVQRSNEEMKNE